MIFRTNVKDVQKNSDVLESIESKTHKTNKQKEIEKKIIDICNKLYPNSKIIHNFFFETKKGKTLIDIIMINKDGIFVFDSKDISCEIVSGFKKEKITIQNKFGKKFVIINPVKYNTYSCVSLNDILEIKIKNVYKNIIVFGDEIQYDESTTLKYGSISRLATLENIIKEKGLEVNDIYKEEDILLIYNKLLEQRIKIDE